MKPLYISPLFALLLLFSPSSANAAGSVLRIICTGVDVGAAVSLNGKFKGECPVDMEVKEGSYKLRVEKSDASYDYVFEQDIRMGDGVVKKVEAVLTKYLNAAGQKAENARLAAEKVAEDERMRKEAIARQKDDNTKQAEINGIEMVSIPGKNYEFGKFEVTQLLWRAVMGSNPSKLHCEPRTVACISDNHPVANVSWRFIVESFLPRLNAMTGKQYRLPTEAEWEFACSGGNQTENCGRYTKTINFGWGLSNLSNDSSLNQDMSTHPVGQKQANGYGLYDMTGSIWELTSDGPSNSSMPIMRGGSFHLSQQEVLVSGRGMIDPGDSRYEFVGFRLARTLP